MGNKSRGNTSAKVVVIVWGPTEHRGHLVLMIIKKYLLTTNHLVTGKWFTAQYSPGLGQGKDKRNCKGQDGVSYANSHIPSLPGKLIIVVVTAIVIASTKISQCWSIPWLLQAALALHSFCLLPKHSLLYSSPNSFWIYLLKITTHQAEDGWYRYNTNKISTAP